MKKSRKNLLYTGLLLLTAVLVFLLKREYDFKQREKMYDDLILAAADRHNIPPSFIKAVIRKESKFVENIRGDHGEYGLMQITEGAADDWIRENRKKKFKSYEQLMNPGLNIEIGSWYLAKGYKKYQDYKDAYALALAHYNAGPSAVIKNDWVPDKKGGEVIKLITFPTTKAYIKDILRFKEAYKRKGFKKDE